MDSILPGNKVVDTVILQYYKLMSQLCANFVPKVEWALLFTASFLNRLLLEHYIYWWKLYLAAHASRKTENKNIIYWNKKTYYFILLIHYNFYILCFTDFMNSLTRHLIFVPRHMKSDKGLFWKSRFSPISLDYTHKKIKFTLKIAWSVT